MKYIMETKNTSFITQNRNIFIIALVTALLLMVPFLAMQFNVHAPDPGSSVSNGVNWSLMDFIVAGTLIFSTGLVLELINRKVKSLTHKIVFGIVALAIFFYIWAELAVGVFFNFGS